MIEEGRACYTFEAAMEMVVKMESDSFSNYLDAIRKVENKRAREILRDVALNELEHKYQVEKAAVEGGMDFSVDMPQSVPTMNLKYVLAKKELRPDSDAREALAYAIHLKKDVIEFYKKMAKGCDGAPMASLFGRMLAEESRHLQTLEDLYEERFLTEN
jgi:rubrerythrin